MFSLRSMSRGRLVAINGFFILWNAAFLAWDIRTGRNAPLTIFQAMVFGFQVAISWESYMSWRRLSQFERELQEQGEAHLQEFQRRVVAFFRTLPPR
jgi:hypothetical protein